MPGSNQLLKCSEMHYSLLDSVLRNSFKHSKPPNWCQDRINCLITASDKSVYRQQKHHYYPGNGPVVPGQEFMLISWVHLWVTWFLVLVDSHSKWIEAHVMSSVTSTLTIQCLRRIFATFGLPEVVVTDNGPSLVSDEFEAWLKRNGIRHKTSPPYHPATNGLAERAVQTVKRGVKKMKSGTLSDKIARFLFAYRNTPHSTTGTTPAELLMGHKLRSPLDLLKPDLHIRVEEKQEKQKQYHDRIAHQRSFAVGDLVFIRNFSRSSTDQWIPGEVISTTGPRSFRVIVPDGRILRRHIDHIRIRTAPLSQKESELGGQSSAPGDDLQFPRRSFSTDPDMDSPTVPQEASASLSPSNVHCPQRM